METTYWCVQHPNLPTFYLNADVSGITEAADALRIGLIVMGLSNDEAYRVSVGKV